MTYRPRIPLWFRRRQRAQAAVPVPAPRVREWSFQFQPHLLLLRALAFVVIMGIICVALLIGLLWAVLGGRRR